MVRLYLVNITLVPGLDAHELLQILELVVAQDLMRKLPSLRRTQEHLAQLLSQVVHAGQHVEVYRLGLQLVHLTTS